MTNRHGHAGFTLMELLVIAAIVSLLAALAVPHYASYKGRAVDTVIQTGLHDAASAMESYHSTNDYTYAGASTNGLVAQHGLRVSDGLTLAVVAVPDRYWVVGEASGATGTWTLISETGRIQRLSSGSGTGGTGGGGGNGNGQGQGNGNKGGRSGSAPGKQRAPGQNR